MISSDPIAWGDPGPISVDTYSVKNGSGEVIRTYGIFSGRRESEMISNIEIPMRLTPKILIAFIDESDPDGPIIWSETLPVMNMEISQGIDDYPTMTIEVALIK